MRGYRILLASSRGNLYLLQ